jgi:hypothetical protein
VPLVVAGAGVRAGPTSLGLEADVGVEVVFAAEGDDLAADEAFNPRGRFVAPDVLVGPAGLADDVASPSSTSLGSPLVSASLMVMMTQLPR